MTENNKLDNIVENINDINEVDLFDKTAFHISVIKRSTKKRLTFVEGLDKVLSKDDLKKTIKKWGKKLCCTVSKVNNNKSNNKDAIQLQGDHREFIKDYLIKNKLATKNDIEVHGF